MVIDGCSNKRDSNKARLYKLEAEIRDKFDFELNWVLTEQEMIDYFESIIVTMPNYIKPTLRFSKRIKSYLGHYSPEKNEIVIALNDKAMKPYILLHELAHAIDACNIASNMYYTPDHSTNFVTILIELLYVTEDIPKTTLYEMFKKAKIEYLTQLEHFGIHTKQQYLEDADWYEDIESDQWMHPDMDEEKYTLKDAYEYEYTCLSPAFNNETKEE